MNYENEIKIAKEKKIIDNADIFDFRETPNEALFLDYYNFCREHLDNNEKILNIEPSAFIFTTYLSSNAKAQYFNDTFSIHINIGLLRFCDQNFLKNINLDEHLNKQYAEQIKFFDNPISVLAFQVATQFTYYHEFAHLVQFSKKREYLSLQEKYNIQSDYNRDKHCLETNADTLASIAIASHIQQYIRKIFGEEITQENVEFTILILCSCLLNHIANFCNDLTKIYFKEHEHPHPFLRLFIVNLNIANYLNQSEFLKEKKIEIKVNHIFKNILEFYGDLEKNKIFNTSLKETMGEAFKQQKEIKTFLGDLIDFNLKGYNDAVDMWNTHIT